MVYRSFDLKIMQKRIYKLVYLTKILQSLIKHGKISYFAEMFDEIKNEISFLVEFRKDVQSLNVQF